MSRVPRGGTKTIPPGPRTLLLSAAAAAYAVVAGYFRPLTAPSEFSFLILGAGYLVWALRRPASDSQVPRPTLRSAVPWLVWAAVFGIWEFVALGLGGPAHPTLSALALPILTPHFARSVAYLLWLSGGVWLARR